MNVRAYSIYDRKALLYTAPFYQVNDSAAIRALVDAVSDPSSAYGRHPEDYVLYYVGWFDDNSGLFTTEALVHVIDANACVQLQRHASQEDANNG